MDKNREIEIIKNVIGGQMDEFKHLINQYKPQIYGMVVRQGIDKEVAKDITQETFIKAYKNLKKFNHHSNFGTWATKIALNQTASYYRSKHFKQKLKTTHIGDREFKAESNDKDQIKNLKHHISALKPKYRDVLVLSSFENKSHQEISEILKIPYGRHRRIKNK